MGCSDGIMFLHHAQGLHSGAMKFAMESKSMRGSTRGFRGLTVPDSAAVEGKAAQYNTMFPADSPSTRSEEAQMVAQVAVTQAEAKK